MAVEPTEGKLYAPADGVVDNVFDTNHAIGIVTDGGAEILLHIGIDTVKLRGKYYQLFVKKNQRIKKGDLLISFDLDSIKREGYKATTPVVICNSGDYKMIKPLSVGEITAGEKLMEVNI